jgi:transcriptional regulator with XRE-family HTH domain
MDNTPGWVQRVMSDSESRQAYEREKLILSATAGIWEIMEISGLKKAEIARRLGKTRANIGQMLSGSRNMTLRTLADLAYACESRVHLDFQPVEEGTGPDIGESRGPVRLDHPGVPPARMAERQQALV